MKHPKTLLAVMIMMFFFQIQSSASSSTDMIKDQIENNFAQNLSVLLIVPTADFMLSENPFTSIVNKPTEPVAKMLSETREKHIALASNDRFTVEIEDNYNGEVHFQILDSKSQLIERKTKFIHKGKNKFQLKNNYPAGTYFITINYGGETFFKRLIKE